MHGFLDQHGHPVFISLGGHSSFTHEELWIGLLDPLALNVYESKAPNMLLWGHTSCLDAERQQLWVFGGRGPHGELSNSVHCISTQPIPKFDHISTLHAPLPRYRHAAALDGNMMVIFGGVVHLGSAFKKKKYDNTVAVFDTQKQIWHTPPIAAGPKPSNRCDHTLTLIREGVFLMMFGCLEDDDKPCNEIWELTRVLTSGACWSWRQIHCSGAPIAGVFAHSAIVWNNCVVYFGGMKATRTGKNVLLCSDLNIVDTVSGHHHVILSQVSPSGRCGHGCTLYRNTMVLLIDFSLSFGAFFAAFSTRSSLKPCLMMLILIVYFRQVVFLGNCVEEADTLPPIHTFDLSCILSVVDSHRNQVQHSGTRPFNKGVSLLLLVFLCSFA